MANSERKRCDRIGAITRNLATRNKFVDCAYAGEEEIKTCVIRRDPRPVSFISRGARCFRVETKARGSRLKREGRGRATKKGERQINRFVVRVEKGQAVAGSERRRGEETPRGRNKGNCLLCPCE